MRPLAACRWIEQRQTPPPIEMDKLKEVFSQETLIWDFLNHLIEDKKKGTELGVIESPILINRWIEKQLSYYTNFANSLPDLVKDTVPLSNFFYKTVMENKK